MNGNVSAQYLLVEKDRLIAVLWWAETHNGESFNLQ